MNKYPKSETKFKRELSLKVFPCKKKEKSLLKKTVTIQVKYVVFKEEWMIQENQRHQVVKKPMWKHIKATVLFYEGQRNSYQDWNVQLCQELDAEI